MSVAGVGPAPIAERRRVHDEAELRALVERAKSDADAFAALYRTFLSPVYGFAFRRCGTREVAEDITSATFERVCRALPSFEWRGGGFEPWLFRIAATEVAAHYRRQARGGGRRGRLATERDDGLEAVDVVDAMAGDGDNAGVGGYGVDADRLRSALTALRPRYQQAISLRYLAGLSHEEAATAMGCSKAVMAVTLHRAVAALRRVLATDGASGREVTT